MNIRGAVPFLRPRREDERPTEEARRPREPQPAAERQDGDPGLADELRARRAEIARMEERALREAESIKTQRADLDRRLETLEDRERNL